MSNDDDAQRPNGGWTNRSIYELLVEVDKRYASQILGVYDAIGAADKRYEQRFLAQEKAVDSALIEREKAVIKAEIASEKRFDALANTFTEKIDSLATSRDAQRRFRARALCRLGCRHRRRDGHRKLLGRNPR